MIVLGIQTEADDASVPEDLSFQADIYGDQNLENIAYSSDLGFHSFGGFGTNSHTYAARLRSGDEVAYAISAHNPNAFSIEVTNADDDTVSLLVTNDDYSSGTVSAPGPNQLQFTWAVEQSGIHLNLHRYIVLDENARVHAQHVVSEVFAIENLGDRFTLDSFTEYLHIDDKTAARDFDCDGVAETLLAINSYSSNGYPVFGKLYEQEQNLHTKFAIEGNYATAQHFVYREFGEVAETDILTATYVSSTAKNGIDAEQQVADDIRALLDPDQVQDLWSVRTYNTDDRGGVFLNGMMVAGSRYSHYPDSGSVSVCEHWNSAQDNYLSFASWDLGVCCTAEWGFDLRRNGELQWSEEGSASTNFGLTYTNTLRVSPSNEVTRYEHPAPINPLDGDWELSVSADGGFAFVLIDNLPVAGSTYDKEQTVNVSHLLGEQQNHIHLNTWNDGGGTHRWDFAIKRNGEIIWETRSQIDDGHRGHGYYKHVIITAEGEIEELLSVPLLLQTSRPWSGYRYGNYQDNDEEHTIGALGCWMTSAAMVNNYWAGESSFNTDPGILNSWLRAYEGYNPSHGVIWSSLVQYAARNDIAMSIADSSGTRNDALLDEALNSGNPAIIGVNLDAEGQPQHYVAATGKTIVDGQPTYMINDPYVHGRTTLFDLYGNNYSQILVFDSSSDDRRLLSISAHSPVELLITDPQGRKQGYDPSTDVVWDEIPNAEYFVRTLAADGGSETEADVLESVAFLSTMPSDGQYTIQVFGVDTGSYQLVISASNQGGQARQLVMEGTANDGSEDVFEISYNSYSGLGHSVFLPIVWK
jgi:hypothetical protein